MKKALSALLSLVMMLSTLSAAAVPVYAQESQVYQSGDYKYKIIDGAQAQITEYIGNDKDITVPDKLDEYNVTSIGESAFERNANLNNVTIPGGIVSINSEAFLNCTELISVNMLNGVKSIGYSAFSSCPNLVNVTIPDSVENFDRFSFSYCENLKNIVIPSNAKSISVGLFEGCINLKSVTIPVSTQRIMTNAFSNCYNLNDVYYCASEQDWNKISIENGNTCLTQANINLHGSTDGTVITEPTCTTDGTGISKCKICNWEGQYSIPAKGHISNGTEEIVKEPNCSETSLKNYTCSVCGEAYSETLPTTSTHRYGLGKVVKDPICSTPGLVVYTCEDCGKKLEVTLDPLDHHTYDNGIYKVNPTCNECGIKTYTCIGCGHKYDNIVSPKSDKHKFNSQIIENATCHSTGVIKYTCKMCKYSYLETIPMKNHTYNLGITTKQPTCYQTGECTFNCTICDSSYIKTLPISEHLYKETVKQEPTCEAEGIIVYTCTQCGSSYTEAIKKTPHIYEQSIDKAGIDNDGKITEACIYCKDVKSITAIPKISSVALSESNYTYNGDIQTPSVTVKDSTGKALENDIDYTVSYANGRTDAGRYAVNVTFKGNYSTSKTLHFTIQPRTTTISVSSAVNGFKVNWTKISETTGYQIEYSTRSDFKGSALVYGGATNTLSKTITGRACGTKYYVRVRTYKTLADGTRVWGSWSKSQAVTTKVAQASVKSVTGVTKGFKTTWNKIGGVTGYQIQYSTRSDFKGAATVYAGDKNAVEKTITGRAKNTTYYIRVRGYKNNGNGNYVWGAWSPAKAVKTK